ncbi:tetratricopeptide repeat protein [Pseudomonas putida]|uniref:Sel1 repeat family protein n=1 Tax=Pseudomonas putida TaxID=303 RepID=A0A1X1A638_PSEPU|nr:sel1 repeat family protein [Pseudomonas putida]ORL67345.1 hypothetical protein B7H17_03255 [Pseudomonas putida]
MEGNFRLNISSMLIAVCFATPFAHADDIDDGKAAFRSKDYSKAAELLSQPAQNGDSVAQAYLGYIFEFGLGKKANKAEAFRWYEKSATQGSEYSQQKLGVFYELGIGVKKDLAKAASWYAKAVEQGDANAEGNLARLYESGKGVPKNLAKAVELYRKAANQGNSAAQSNLGNLYHNGKGVPEDFEQARKWYTKAAMQGNTTALYNLGVMFRDGDGVTKDLMAAHIYFNLSAANGDSDAKAERNALSRKLSPANLKAAQQFASTWKPGEELPNGEGRNEVTDGDELDNSKYAASERIEYFEITLHSCSVKSKLNFQNKSAEPKSSTDSEFLILDVSFKNEDTESRLPFAGSVFINYGGKRYKFDNPETIWQDGWGLRFGKINPLLTERTKLVYKIPLYMRGEVDWVPGRNPENAKLTCGI